MLRPASGGLTIAAGVSGPLIDIFFVRSHMDRRQVVATKAMIQVVAHSIKIIFYLGAALALSAGEWAMVLLAAPLPCWAPKPARGSCTA